MKTKSLVLIASAAATACLTTSAYAATFLVGETMQVQTTTDVTGTLLQAGWDLVDGSRNQVSISGVVDGVTITVDGSYGRAAGTSSDGGNYLVTNHTDGDLDNLLSSGRLVNNAADNIDLTLQGLADGDYSITTYHHTFYSPSDDVTFDVLVTDFDRTDVLVHNDLVSSFGSSVTTADISTAVTFFTVSGGNDVTLTFDPEATGFDGLDQLLLNGFQLTFVPEPSSTALLGLGLSSLLLRRRRS